MSTIQESTQHCLHYYTHSISQGAPVPAAVFPTMHSGRTSNSLDGQTGHECTCCCHNDEESAHKKHLPSLRSRPRSGGTVPVRLLSPIPRSSVALKPSYEFVRHTLENADAFRVNTYSVKTLSLAELEWSLKSC